MPRCCPCPCLWWGVPVGRDMKKVVFCILRYLTSACLRHDFYVVPSSEALQKTTFFMPPGGSFFFLGTFFFLDKQKEESTVLSFKKKKTPKLFSGLNFLLGLDRRARHSLNLGREAGSPTQTRIASASAETTRCSRLSSAWRRLIFLLHRK